MDGKILISCRDEECRNLLLNLFSGKELQLSTVVDDADFLLEVLERDYQVIIYDLDDSTINGLKMVRILRKIRPKVSLVVISNNASKKLGGKILQEGVAYYAVKPIITDAIEQVVTA